MPKVATESVPPARRAPAPGRADVDQILASIEGLIKSELAASLPELQAADFDDMAQAIRLACVKAVPRFNGQCKPATYFYPVIRGVIAHYIRRPARRPRTPRLRDVHAAADTSADRAVEQLASEIMDSPSAFIRARRRADVLNEILVNPDVKPTAIARKLGMTPKAVSNLIYHLRNEICDLANAKLLAA